ncbi:hypothetical protein Nepgr_023256 [Nepenthes gracilis]|uniref:Uncharacterized protein n=1 Tax=Nepenthes gracilis TaxID=150966 RepID=A0AAD3T2I1_NEPGR|nr:hypothetical protein Nepgr_023256 [Nepenthes gracilis]
MAGNLLRFLVIILVLSTLIIFSDAVPVTRSRSLMRALQPAEDAKLLGGREEIRKEKFINGGMEPEIDDYVGSGANNRHDPRAQFGRGCANC